MSKSKALKSCVESSRSFPERYGRELKGFVGADEGAE